MGNRSSTRDHNRQLSFWQALNAASAALQKAAHSETAVYDAFSQEFRALNLYGVITLLDESGTHLVLQSLVFPEALQALAGQIIKNFGHLFRDRIPVSQSPLSQQVVQTATPVFLPSNDALIETGLPKAAWQLLRRLGRPFLNKPAILAPLTLHGQVTGTLYLSGTDLVETDLLAITGFTHQLAIALENARLFQRATQAENRLLRLFQGAADGIVLINVNTAKIEAVNGRMLQWTGLQEADLVGKDIRHFTLLSNPPDMIMHMWQRLLQEREIFFEFNLRHLNDAILPTAVSASIIEIDNGQLIQAIVRDISAQKQADLALQQLTTDLHQQLQIVNTVISQVPYHLWVYDVDGRVAYANPLAAEVLQTTTDQLIGKKIADLNFGADATNTERRLRQTIIATGKPQFGEYTMTLHNQTLSIEYTLIPIFNNQGEVSSIMATINDITDRKKKQEAMYHAQKLESLGVMAGGIAHDFNNLLAVMMAQATLALAKESDTCPSRPHLEKLVTATRRAADLTHQLLAYSGRGQFTIAPLDLNALIEDNRHLFQSSIPKHVLLAWDLRPSLPAIQADRGQMQQIVMNLILNAAEAIQAESGCVQVTTKLHTLSQTENHYWKWTNQPLPPGEYVSLTVEDNGVGIPGEKLAHIFDPFYTTKFTGRGLGLAAVLGIVRGHGGGLHVSSQPQIGSVFEVILPIVPTPPADRLPNAHTPPPARSQDAVVLVVDDETAVCEAVHDILETIDITVLMAHNGQSALDLYRQRQHDIDLILLDLSMPGMSGSETFHNLRQINPAIAVIFSSGYTEADTLTALGGVKPAGFIKKPYDVEQLIDIVHYHLVLIDDESATP